MINALIPTFIIRNIINLMLKKKWGRIVNCTTIGIKFGGGEFSYNYNLAKHCLEFIPNKFKFWAKTNVLIDNIRIGHTNCKLYCLLSIRQELIYDGSNRFYFRRRIIF